MGNNRNTCINAKHFDTKQKKKRNLNEPSVVDSSDAKTTEKDKKRTLLRETLQKIRHDIEVLTIKIILKDDPCFVETSK